MNVFTFLITESIDKSTFFVKTIFEFLFLLVWIYRLLDLMHSCHHWLVLSTLGSLHFKSLSTYLFIWMYIEEIFLMDTSLRHTIFKPLWNCLFFFDSWVEFGITNVRSFISELCSIAPLSSSIGYLGHNTLCCKMQHNGILSFYPSGRNLAIFSILKFYAISPLMQKICQCISRFKYYFHPIWYLVSSLNMKMIYYLLQVYHLFS